MNKLLVFVSICALLVGVGCKDKPSEEPKKPVKTAVVEKKVVKDTTDQDTLKTNTDEEPTQVDQPADKYFLIAGSFASRRNADQFMAKLMGEGYQSIVIERPGGPNAEFYKVAYKAFYDRNEAYAELKTARHSEGRNDVWLLVK